MAGILDEERRRTGKLIVEKIFYINLDAPGDRRRRRRRRCERGKSIRLNHQGLHSVLEFHIGNGIVSCGTVVREREIKEQLLYRADEATIGGKKEWREKMGK